MTQEATAQPQLNPLLAKISENLQPSQWVPSLVAGSVTGTIGVIRAISYAALIFSGPLAASLSTGVGMAVFSTAIVSATAAIASDLPGMIATPLAAPTAILAILAGAIALQMGETATPETLFLTVSVAIALSSLLTGVFLWLLGRFQLGTAIRFIPYPVVGGFMAGTGWLLVDGFVQVTADTPLTFAELPTLLEPQVLLHWGVGLIFALILLGVSNRFKHYLVMPGTLLSLFLIFYLFLLATGTPIAQARAEGWLLGPFPDGGLWHPLAPSELGGVSWSAIAAQAGSMITVALISLLSLVLSNSGIELVVGRDIDLNTELRSIGLACFASGLGSGMVGNQALPSTLLVNDIGGKSRLTGIIAALPCVAVLLLGSSFLSYFPKPVLGALLLYLGLSLLIQWLYQAWFKLPLADYLTVVVILVVINAVGFLQGVVVGFVIATLLFMYNYSRVNVVKTAASGATTRSNAIRTAAQSQHLQENGDRIYILELQGFLFFGTANALLEKVRDRCTKAESQPPVRFVLIDFRQVSGLDSSAVLSFDKMLKLARQHQLTLVFANLSAEFQAKLVQGGVLEKDSNSCPIFPHALCQLFPDIDRGLEWCENTLLQQQDGTILPPPLAAQLTQLFLNPEQVEAFLPYLEPYRMDASQTVFEQGKPSPHLYFLEFGQVSVLLDLPEGQTKRLQTVTGGNILGEMRFYGKTPLSTSVVADTPCSLHALTRTEFARMKANDPELATQLESYIVSVLCDSLVRREQQLQVMQ